MRAGKVGRVDQKDQAIIRVLKADARISNKDLAERVGLSNSACFERVRRLERTGMIKGYHARVASEFDTPAFEVWANIALLDLPKATQDDVQQFVGDCSHVVAAFQLSGALDYLVHFAAEEALAWRHFCGELAAIGVGPDRVRFGLIVGGQKR